MEEKIYFLKLRRLFIFFFLCYLTTSSFSAQSNNCQAYTLTQGGWGAPNVDNPHVSYLYANFDAAFPQGITVGCTTGNMLKLTSASAITDFLPSGSTARALDAGTMINPGGAYSNVLAAQLVSVMLAVGFDNYDEGFSVSNSNLGDFVFVSGPFQGKTVNQFLSLANNFMGGCGSSSYSAADFNAAATAINENYDEGNRDLGYLKCCILQINVSYDAIKCYGGKTVVHVSAEGGSSATTGTGDFEVGAGTHTFTIVDGDCSSSQTITISQPEQLVVTAEFTPILCHGGLSTVTVTASGGTAPYSGTGTFQVSAGTYTYVVTDANGCVASKEIVVIEPNPLIIEVSAPPILCINGTVVVTATATGGTAPYTYLWSNGSTESTATLGVGDYSVTVTDYNGCKAIANGKIIPPSCGGFTTVTQGGWGAKAAGNNWGKYRDSKFAGAFPTGLTIGSGSRFLKLTSAKAVDDFLPSGTTPRALNAGTMTNPGGYYSNVLAGQVVALTLSVRFDLYDPNFSASNSNLGDLVVISGTFANWTVNQILAEANKILGGQSSSYSASEINAIVDAINNNYDGGKMNNGLLTCPCPNAPAAKGENNGQAVEPQTIVPETNNAMVLYPNPSNGEFNLKFDAKSGTQVIVQLYDATGKLIGDFSNKVMRSGNNATLNVNNPNLANGMYMVKVKTSEQEKTIKLIIRK